MIFLSWKGKKQHYAADVFKLIYYFSCCQLTSVMDYIRLKAEKKELKKLRQANESNRPNKIQTTSPVSDAAYIPMQSVVEALSRSDTGYENKSINNPRDHHLI
jgi:hypothetical protein